MTSGSRREAGWLAGWERTGWGRTGWGRTDWGIVIAGLGLSGIGAALVWSATRHTAGSGFLLKHVVNTAVGVAGFVVVTRIDHRTLRAWAPWVYLLSLAGLLAVLSPLGSTINGSRSWIQLPGGFSMQPSELAKVALSVGLAMVLAEGRDRDRAPGARDLVAAWGMVLVPVALVMLQPDLGSAVVLVAMAFAVVAVAGAPTLLLAGTAVVGAAGVLAMFTTNLLSAYQRARLTAFLDPAVDPEGIGYQTRQVRAAISSGGWFGQGLLHGSQTQGGYVPFQQTDFVFSVAGEELGFVGAAGIVVLIVFLVLRTLVIGARSDPFGQLVCVGVAMWFGVQAFENIGMNLGIMPVTGLPLPFLSYGGSSMFAGWLALALVNNAHVSGVGHR
ncbi:rod shape-determining protein RodA [Lapillicoccus sp.]|uniref:rod shape-determining protein RodA n=1 Tax=Lapillicoccus sp. TaxID=1909287 RepID=UPI00326307E4